MTEIISPKTLGLTYSGDVGGINWFSMRIDSLEGSPSVVNGSF